MDGDDSGWLCCWGVGSALTIAVDSGDSSELPLLLTEMTSTSLRSETEKGVIAKGKPSLLTNPFLCRC